MYNPFEQSHDSVEKGGLRESITVFQKKTRLRVIVNNHFCLLEPGQTPPSWFFSPVSLHVNVDLTNLQHLSTRASVSDVVSPVCSVMAPRRLDSSCAVTIGVALSRQYHYLSARVTPSCPSMSLFSQWEANNPITRREPPSGCTHIHYRGISCLPTLLTSCLPCFSGSPKKRKEGSDSRSSPPVHFEKEARKEEPRRQGTSN